MSEEIKETLDRTLEYLEGIDKTRGTKILTTNETNILLDYITNLQQKVERLEKENKRLKEENKRIFQNVNDDELLISNAMNYAEVQRLNNIIDKAIEYIENEKNKQNSVGVYTKDIHKNLLKILKGDE